MSRDRHGRGLRGPIARANPYGRTAPLHRPKQDRDLFAGMVAEAVARVRRHCPAALDSVVIAIEEVPPELPREHRVPLTAAMEGIADEPGRLVVFRRPLELRAATTAGLRILVRRALVEQLAALTGCPVADLDPSGEQE